jgi:hypothetical protein
MKGCHTRGVVPAVAGWLVLALAGAAAADPQARPFFAALAGNADPTPTPDPAVLDNHETGTGRASHLGQITWESDESVHLGPAPGQGAVQGEITLTAANGDQVFATYQTVADFDFVTNTVTARGRFEVTGGTGRFRGATGAGVIAAEGSLLPPFTLKGALRGKIAY